MRRKLRWRRPSVAELAEVSARLATWPVSSAGGATRHMFALANIEAQGNQSIRVVGEGSRWACAVVFPGRLCVPCGDAEAIAGAAPVARRWRLLIGDAAAADALLRNNTDFPELIVHDQRFMTVDLDRVPSVGNLADPGLRRALPEDLDHLAALAVRLHVEDQFGPNPGAAGWRGYRQRLAFALAQGALWCVGPLGAPIAKLERAVSSERWGVQLAGIIVDSQVRGRGIGRGIVAAAVRQALAETSFPRPISLHVRTHNLSAIAAYEAAGFVDRESWRLAVRP